MGISEIISIAVTAVMSLLVWSLTRNIQHLDNAIKTQGVKLAEVEQKYNDLRADLPLLFVTQETFVRTINAVDSKMDKHDSKLDRILLIIGGEHSG